MYVIIYWLGDDEVYPYLASDGLQLKIFETLTEADKAADLLEKTDDELDARVITIEGVDE